MELLRIFILGTNGRQGKTTCVKKIYQFYCEFIYLCFQVLLVHQVLKG